MSKHGETQTRGNTRWCALFFVVWACSLVTTLVVVVGTGDSDPILVVPRWVRGRGRDGRGGESTAG